MYVPAEKVLGVCWRPVEDLFCFKVTLNFSGKRKLHTEPDIESHQLTERFPAKLTKRMILSQINSIYEPLGLAGPFTVRAKIMKRKLWMSEAEWLNWDDPVSDECRADWNTFFSDLFIMNNIRVFCIPESAGETWEMAETKVRDAIKEKLNIEVDIERAHLVERRKSGGINQHQIVCRLSSWKQKEAVVRKARKEKPEGLFICEDLSQATLEKRKPHLEKLKAAKQAGKSAYFILDRLIIRDKPSSSSND